MNGPDHYSEAERLVEMGELDGYPGEAERYLRDIARAQVHATLALAAATALANYCGDRMTEGDSRRWFEAASAHPEHLRLRREADRAEAAEFTQSMSLRDEKGMQA